MADVSFLRVGDEQGGSPRRDSQGIVASIIHYRIDCAQIASRHTSRSFISSTTQSMNTRSFALTWRFGGYAM